MSKSLYFEKKFVTLHQKKPADLPHAGNLEAAPLYVNGVKVTNKYGLEFGFRDPGENGDGFDYPEFQIVGVSFTSPSNFSERLTFQSESSDGKGYTTSYSRFGVVSVPDGFAIPPDVPVILAPTTPENPSSAGFQLDGPGDQSSSIGNVTFDFSKDLVGNLSVGDFKFATTDNGISALSNALNVAGLSNLANSIRNAAAVRTALQNIHSDGLDLIRTGVQNMDNPNFNLSDFDARVNAYMQGARAQAYQALDNVTLVPGNAAADALAHSIIKNGDMIATAARTGSVPLSASAQLGLEVNFGDILTISASVTGTVSADVVLAGEGNQDIRGTEARSFLVGGSGANTIHGGAGHDYLNGGAGNDVLVGGVGNDFLVGGAGHDVVLVDEGRRTVEVTGTTRSGSPGWIPWTVSPASGADFMFSIEEVRLVDGRVVFDPADPAAQVVRLYNAALARGPEQAGLNYHVEAVQKGAPLSEVAAGFASSPEFSARFGANLPLDQYITRLYVNVLNRTPGEAELQYYRNEAAQGITREQNLVGFAESPENKTRTTGIVESGIWDVSENAVRVARIYDTMFSRLPDLAGVKYYRDLLDTGAGTLPSIVQNFTSSPEFRALYGSAPSSAAFVELLYRNTLNRAAQAAELDYYVSRLDNGSISRADAVLAFSESPEHQAITAPDTMSDAKFGILFA